MSDDLTKTAATSFTSGLGALDVPKSASVAVGAQFIPINTTVVLATVALPIPNKTQAIATPLFQYTGLSGINRGIVASAWYPIPQDFTWLDGSNRPGTFSIRYARSGGQIVATASGRGGSGGFQLPAFTATLKATFFQLPF